MKQIYSLVVFLMVTCLSAGTASAAKPSWAGKDKQQSATSESSVETVSGRHEEHGRQLFSERERELIRSYYHGDAVINSDQKSAKKGKSGKESGKKQRALPPGLQKKLARGGELPAGWQKKVAAGQTLDAELYKHSDVVPQELDVLLDEVVGAETRRIGNKVIKVLEGDATVIDVIDISDVILNNSSQ